MAKPDDPLWGPGLILLFNRGFDFARKVEETYHGCSDRKRATHKLVCTKWNTPCGSKDVRTRLRADKTRPGGWALSVCAVPLKRRAKSETIRLKRPIPPEEAKTVPLYRQQGSLEGKRRVLVFMAKNHRTPTKMARMIRRLSSAECDRWYRNLRRAEQRAGRRAQRLLRKQRARAARGNS